MPGNIEIDIIGDLGDFGNLAPTRKSQFYYGNLGVAAMIPAQAKARARAMARKKGKRVTTIRPGAKRKRQFTPAQEAAIRAICLQAKKNKAKRVGGVPMRIRRRGGKMQIALQTNPVQGIGEICEDYVDTFFGDADGISVGQLGGINLDGLKKGMAGALNGIAKGAGEAGKGIAKAAAGAVKEVAKGYNKLAAAMDVNKGKKDELVVKMNRIKGRIQAIEAKGLKNPKSVAELDKLKKEYAAIAVKAKKEGMKVDELLEKQKTMKVAGAVEAIKIVKGAQKEAAKGGTAAGGAESKLTPGAAAPIAPAKVGELGIAPLVIAAVVGIAAAAAVAAVLITLIGNSGKLEKTVETSEKQINEWESNWKEVKVPFNPETQPYTEQISITDPATGQEVTAVRVGDQMMMPVAKGKAQQESFMKEVQRQEGNAEGELGKTGQKATQSLFDEIGLWPIVAVGGLVVLGFGIYIVTKKKKAPVAPAPAMAPQQNPRTIDIPPWAYSIS